MIQNALRLVRHTLPASVKIDVDIEPNHQLLIADKTQMVQVVVNLCTNAWHAMEPDGGHMIVGLIPATKDGSAMTKLTVSDTGVGMSQDALTRIFEPFYTTRAVGEGTGIGLSMVHGIISKLGGSIEVDSQLGQGSSFQIYLPVTDQQPLEVEDPETTTFSETASILVVDDDEALAGILKSMLTDLGYETEVHLDGKSALDNFRLHPAQYDMVMTDLTMPDISGVALCDQIRQIEPQIPVFILTGYSKDMVHDQLANRDRCHVVGKPLERADLAAALAKELH